MSRQSLDREETLRPNLAAALSSPQLSSAYHAEPAAHGTPDPSKNRAGMDLQHDRSARTQQYSPASGGGDDRVSSTGPGEYLRPHDQAYGYDRREQGTSSTRRPLPPPREIHLPTLGRDSSDGDETTVNISQGPYTKQRPTSASKVPTDELDEQEPKISLAWCFTFGHKHKPRPRTLLEQRLHLTRKCASTKLLEARAFTSVLIVALFLQIILGAITTTVSACVTGKKVSVAVSVVGAFSTIVAAIIARLQASGEPTRSRRRIRELDKFIRHLDDFVNDPNSRPKERTVDDQIRHFKDLLEEILERGPDTKIPRPKGYDGPKPEIKNTTGEKPSNFSQA